MVIGCGYYGSWKVSTERLIWRVVKETIDDAPCSQLSMSHVVCCVSRFAIDGVVRRFIHATSRHFDGRNGSKDERVAIAILEHIISFTMATFLTSLLSFLKAPTPGDSEEHPMQVHAVPGLMTLLDVALFHTVEGQLTATLTTSHALLAAWLDLKKQAIVVLRELGNELDIGMRRSLMENFARACLESSQDAIERLTTDKLAQSANLSEPFEQSSSVSSSSVGNAVFSGIGSQSMQSSLQESARDTARRHPLSQRPRDCWESPRLYCPDTVWADDAAQTHQRLLRTLYKHPFCGDSVETSLVGSLDNTTAGTSSNRQPLAPKTERQAALLLQLLQTDIPARLVQFRTAMEADSVVAKRLYLIKCEYRAPFRAFLEGHQTVQRAPNLLLVNEYLGLSSPAKVAQRGAKAKQRLKALLETPELVEALALERQCEEFEMDMAKALFPFCELARFLDHRKARLKVVPGTLTESAALELQETLRRLKGLLCRKTSNDMSSGIRPLLLDLQGVPRDEEQSRYPSAAIGKDGSVIEKELDRFVDQLQLLATLCETRGAFRLEKRTELDLPSSSVQGCTDLDDELFRCQMQDWCAMAQRQKELTLIMDFEELAENIRRAEMEISFAVASEQSLEKVRQRLELITTDREKRLQVLQEMVQEVCLREMNLHVQVIAPDRLKLLVLQPTSASGIFGLPLTIAGEALPIG